MTEATLTTVQHKLLGPLLRLTVAPGLAWNFTRDEALTLARAMTALGHKRSLANEVYLSPQACDHEFYAKVTDEGFLVLADAQQVLLDWAVLSTLAEELTY